MAKTALTLLIAAGSILVAEFSAAAATRFITQLDTTGGIGPGDPVTYAGLTIGRVTDVKALSGGDSQIAFEVDQPHAIEIRELTIMVLTSCGGVPCLDALNTEWMSPAAPWGFTLDGASSMTEAQMFVVARGPGIYGQMLAGSRGPSAKPATPSPADAQMQSLLTQLSQRTMAAVAASSPATHAQLDQMRREAEGVMLQLRRRGKAAEADRLQQQVDTTLSGVGAPSSTMTIPRPNPPSP